jgi:hypothetical protein
MRVAQLNATGNGAAAPTISEDYNVTSVIRVSIGLYEVQLQTWQLYGVDILNHVVPTLTFTSTETGTGGNPIVKGANFVTGDASTGKFRFEVYRLDVQGQNVERVLDDMETGEAISINVFLIGDSGDEAGDTGVNISSSVIKY